MNVINLHECDENPFKQIAVTGLQAGANISGDLKDPASSIPKGTLLALLISAISYAVFVVFAGGSALRDASGIVNVTTEACLKDLVSNFHYKLSTIYIWWHWI